MEDKPKATCLVTGGSRGIGAGIVTALFNEGFDIIIADLIPPEYIPDKKIHFVQGDISEGEDRNIILEYCKNTFDRLDLLVNNAGISVEKRGDMLDSTEESLDKLLNVNLKGPFFLTQIIARWMIAERVSDKAYFPQIVNIASLTSYASSSYMAEYALSKSAVSMMTKLYADRLSEHNINVYEIRPGIIKTSMTAPSQEKYDAFIAGGGLPISRWGLPQDVGNAVVAIAKRLLAYSTGEVINVDGGYHLRRL